MPRLSSKDAGILIVALCLLSLSYLLFSTRIHARLPFYLSAFQAKALSCVFMAFSVFLLIRILRKNSY